LWKKLLAEYVPPPIDPAVKEAIVAYVARRTEEIGREA
jgi:trimethylamine--corrinoid protein Co-methyltransferase